MENKIEVVDEMKPLKDYLLGKSSTDEFINDCREISKTENAEFEIVEPKQLPPVDNEKHEINKIQTA